MSDLHCAARIILARHGEAEYEGDLLLDMGGSLTDLGRDQARELGSRLRGERVAHVVTSAKARAVQTGELAAAALGVEVSVREGLQELSMGDYFGTPAGQHHFEPLLDVWATGDLSPGVPGGETGEEIADRMMAVLDSLADQFRGETVLVVSHGGAMCCTLSRIHGSQPTSRIDNCGSFTLEVDSDGWVLAS